MLAGRGRLILNRGLFSPCLVLLLFSFPGVSTGLAQDRTFTVSAEQSEVVFSLGDVLHQVHGTFHIQSGTVRFDERSPEMQGSIVVAAGSGQSGNNTRDRRMTLDILNAPQFPEVSFRPRQMVGSISAIGDSVVQVEGVFTLHGAPHDLTVPMQIHIGGTTCTAKTRFMIPYVKWGLKDPSTFLLRVDKEVGMEITLVGQLSSSTLQ